MNLPECAGAIWQSQDEVSSALVTDLIVLVQEEIVTICVALRRTALRFLRCIIQSFKTPE